MEDSRTLQAVLKTNFYTIVTFRRQTSNFNKRRVLHIF